MTLAPVATLRGIRTGRLLISRPAVEDHPLYRQERRLDAPWWRRGDPPLLLQVLIFLLILAPGLLVAALPVAGRRYLAMGAVQFGVIIAFYLMQRRIHGRWSRLEESNALRDLYLSGLHPLHTYMAHRTAMRRNMAFAAPALVLLLLLSPSLVDLPDILSALFSGTLRGRPQFFVILVLFILFVILVVHLYTRFSERDWIRIDPRDAYNIIAPRMASLQWLFLYGSILVVPIFLQPASPLMNAAPGGRLFIFLFVPMLIYRLWTRKVGRSADASIEALNRELFLRTLGPEGVDRADDPLPHIFSVEADAK